MPTFNTLFTDTFVRANENPLSDGGKWLNFPLSNSIQLQVLNNQCVMTTAGFVFNADYYTGNLPNDQFCQVTVPTWSFADSIANEALLWVRASTSGVIFSDGYNLVAFKGNYNLEGLGQLLAVGNAPFAAGDTLLLAAVGSAIAVYRNGSFLAQVTDSTISSGVVALGALADALADIAFTNFQAGSAAHLDSPTNGAVYGRYNGPQTNSLSSLIIAAFDTTLGNSLQDLLQIVDPFGKVVFNIDVFGVANDNPASPSATAILGQFQAHSGSTRAQYIASAFANPSNLDIIQIVQPGGNVAYYVDYLGNVHSGVNRT